MGLVFKKKVMIFPLSKNKKLKMDKMAAKNIDERSQLLLRTAKKSFSELFHQEGSHSKPTSERTRGAEDA